MHNLNNYKQFESAKKLCEHADGSAAASAVATAVPEAAEGRPDLGLLFLWLKSRLHWWLIQAWWPPSHLLLTADSIIISCLLPTMKITALVCAPKKRLMILMFWPSRCIAILRKPKKERMVVLYMRDVDKLLQKLLCTSSVALPYLLYRTYYTVLTIAYVLYHLYRMPHWLYRPRVAMPGVLVLAAVTHLGPDNTRNSLGWLVWVGLGYYLNIYYVWN